MYKPMIGDIVFFDKIPFEHVITDIQELSNGHTLVHVVTLNNEDGYNGWFNVDKVKLNFRSYFPYDPNPVHKKDIHVEFTSGDAKNLYDPVVEEMIKELNHIFIKDIDDKIRRNLEDE